MLELSLWLSTRTGKYYGNINWNYKETVENINMMLTVPEFVTDTLKRNIATQDDVNVFIENSDENSLYAWTTNKSLVTWNPKESTASVNFRNKNYNLLVETRRRNHKGAPDLFFKCFL